MTDLTRRQALATATAGTLAAAAATGVSAGPGRPPEPPPASPLSSMLLNRARATAEMEKAGVAAIVAAAPQNIFYLTTHYPVLARMGVARTAYAILPRDERLKPILTIGQFSAYYTAADDSLEEHAEIRLYTAPAEADAYAALGHERLWAADLAAPGGLPAVHDAAPIALHETKRRTMADPAGRALHATAEQALAVALRDLGLAGQTVAIDDAALRPLMEAEGLACRTSDGEALLRRIRLQKSPGELEIVRYAARANAEAGLSAAKAARAGAALKDVRREFVRHCAERDLTMEFMVIDRVASRNYDGELKDGAAFMIDCVSHFHHYHGDYGRTIFIGEPTTHMRRATDAMSAVWTQVLEGLRPGLRYSDIRAAAARAARETQVEAAILCNPHSVGLHHTDEPGKPGRAYFDKDDLELVEGMVLSVDIPMIDVGLGGSAHLEDLILITADGAELLNAPGDHVVTV
ncbi:MAG: M24 family metallopeptidase [Pseudomonadota bacterium]